MTVKQICQGTPSSGDKSKLMIYYNYFSRIKKKNWQTTPRNQQTIMLWASKKGILTIWIRQVQIMLWPRKEPVDLCPLFWLSQKIKFKNLIVVMFTITLVWQWSLVQKRFRNAHSKLSFWKKGKILNKLRLKILEGKKPNTSNYTSTWRSFFDNFLQNMWSNEKK